MEYILRQKIYDSLYWKQECFGLSAERIVDKAVALRFAGGMFGEPNKPTEFICLILKMLQIQPDREIILEFIKNDDFKYLRILGAFYLRLTGRPVDVFNYLEPLLNDYRRVRVRDPTGSFSLGYIDDLIDQMLTKDHMFNIALPRLPARQALEKAGQLEPRVSVLEEEFNEEVRKEEEAAAAAAAEAAAAAAAAPQPMEEEGELEEPRRKRERWQLDRDERRRGRGRSRSRSRDRDDGRRRHRSRSREHDRDRDRRRRDDSRDRYYDHRDRDYDRRRRDRSRSRDRDSRRRHSRSPDRKRPRDEEGGGRGGGARDSMSVEETNALRAKLGLPPLK